MKATKIILQLLLILMVITGVALGVRWLFANMPKPKRKPVGIGVAVVEITTIKPDSTAITVNCMGLVEPARIVTLAPQVTGLIIEQHPQLVEGGLLKTGEIVARIDPRDYKLAVESEKGNLERAAFELELEKGRCVVAKQEWSLLGKEIANSEAGRALALRQPHIRNAQAAVVAAESRVKQAKINLERTTITAPFNALVRAEHIETGQLVSPQTPLATLLGTDRFWVRVSVPVEQLNYLAIPDARGGKGAASKITHAAGNESSTVRSGHIVRRLAELDPKGRMAHLIIAVDDPLGLESNVPPLLVNAYVRVEIEGKPFPNVCTLPRLALRDDNTVWIMNDKDKLEVRPVEIVWRTKDSVLVQAGNLAGARIVASSIATPIPGMKLRLQGSKRAGEKDKPKPAKQDGRP